MQEEWRAVVGCEGWYDVSNLGRVRRARPGKATFVGKILRPSRRKKGYMTVYMRREGHDIQAEVHRLVMAAFVGPCPPGKEVNHMDGNPSNNRLDNLEYCTRRENIQHAYRLGLIQAAKGEDTPWAKLDTDKVIVIRSCTAPASVLARVLGVSKPVIQSVRRLRTWRHVH